MRSATIAIVVWRQGPRGTRRSPCRSSVSAKWSQNTSGPRARRREAWVTGCGKSADPDAIPNTMAIAGQVLHQQFVPVELDAQGSITALTSTNGLTLTIGTF